VSWSVAGSYFESCNCDPICPCRRIDGRAGGRSTHGICMGVLSWIVHEGHANGVPLDGLGVAMATWYDDDEPGSPWRFVLWLDERADEEQRDALEAIWRGREGGDVLRHFPWAWKESESLAVRSARIEADYSPRRQWLRIASKGPITCSRAPRPIDFGSELRPQEVRHERAGDPRAVSGRRGAPRENPAV
jgi:hypothetical protein